MFASIRTNTKSNSFLALANLFDFLFFSVTAQKSWEQVTHLNLFWQPARNQFRNSALIAVKDYTLKTRFLIRQVDRYEKKKR